jgi:hypothetical protein
MITNINDIYKRVSEKYDLDLDLIKSVGDHTFSHLKERMMSWEESSLSVSHLGSFVLKSKKIENQIKRWLEVRRYKVSQDPNWYNMPIPKHIQDKLQIYFLKVVPYKKAKKEFAKKQVAVCKQIYESYENDDKPTTDDNELGSVS